MLGGIGLYGIVALDAAGDIVARTYDRPLTTSNTGVPPLDPAKSFSLDPNFVDRL